MMMLFGEPGEWGIQKSESHSYEAVHFVVRAGPAARYSWAQILHDPEKVI